MSIWHLLLLLLVVVLIFGTKKLRHMGADLGGALRDFKKGLDGDEASAPGPVPGPAAAEPPAPGAANAAAPEREPEQRP